MVPLVERPAAENGRAGGTITPRGHMLLAVDVDGGTFIADVGFGGLTPTAPLRLVAEVEHARANHRRKRGSCC